MDSIHGILREYLEAKRGNFSTRSSTGSSDAENEKLRFHQRGEMERPWDLANRF